VSDPILSIRGLTVEFRVRRGVLTAVDNVDFDIYKGEAVGLVGESGCGKSVLAHAIIRQVDPNGYFKSGRVLFEGRNVMSFGDEELRRYRWRDAAIVVQGALNALNPIMRVGEHMIDTYLAHEKASKDDIHKRASDLLKLVRLDPDRVLNLFPHEISGGMKQRIIAAMGLLLDTKLLILDEPTSSLDVLTQKYFLELLRNIHEKTGLTMLYITHDLATVAEIAERVAIMYCGSIVEIGKVEDVFYEPKHPYTAALLNAVPSIVDDIGDVKPLPGPMPDPIRPPPGCKFHPRCPIAEDICSRVRPKLIDIGGKRFVACHMRGDAI